MYFIKKFLFRSTSTGTAANQTDTEIPSNSHSSTACATASDGTFSTAPSTSSISTVASVDIRRIEDIFAAHEAALATGQDIHVRVTFDENGEMVVANMEPLHDFNPCQELSPPLKQEGFLPTDWEERPTTDKPRKKEKGKHDYDRRLRNAVKFVRRAALVGVERPESAASAETVLSVGGRTLAWAVPAGQDARQYSAKLMHALKLLHKHRTLQRDIKPNRIAVSREGRISSADFTV